MKNFLNEIINLPNENVLTAISIVIALMNIITTVILAGVNLYFIQRNRRKENYYKAFLEYYFPIKCKLHDLLREEDLFFQMYNIERKESYYELDYKIRNQFAKECLEPFLKYYNSLPKYCIFPCVDSLIIQLNQYFATVVYMCGVGEIFSVLELEKKYPHCNINKIVKEIDENINTIL